MNHLVIACFIAFLYQASSHDIDKRSIFSWNSETKEPELPTSGYLPILKVHKYNGIQIQPIQGPPVYLPNAPSDSNAEGSIQISSDQIQQLDLINRLANFLPEEDKLQEVDLSAVLPYVDLISEDSIDRIRYAAETTKTKEKSKLLKFLAFLKYIKEKKLKPFKFAASVGSKIVHKKKEKVAWLFGATPTTTPEPYTETPAPVTYPYNFAYNTYSFPNKQYFNTYTTSAPAESSPIPFGSPYYPIYPAYQFNSPSKSPNFENPQYRPDSEPQYQAKLPANPPSTPAPQYSQYPANFQFPELPQVPPSNRVQYHYFQPQDLPAFPFNQYQPQYPPQYPSLPQPTAEPAKNDVVYEYKQTPASTFAAQDNNAIRQFISASNNSEYQYSASSAAPKNEISAEQHYSLPSNFVHPFNFPHQPIVFPKFQQSFPSYSPPSEPNKFFHNSQSSVSNDLTASGSENIEKINEQVKPESSSNIKKESVKAAANELATSTEISFTKSKQSAGKRTILRQVTPKAPVYEASPKEEIIKGNKSTVFLVKA